MGNKDSHIRQWKHNREFLVAIPPEYITQHQVDGQHFTYIPGLDEALAKAALAGQGLAEAGVPWAIAPTHLTLARGGIG
jgi:hypothetical protein